MFSSILVNGIIMGSIYGLIALGYSLIYKASGLMSFAQGDIITLGAYLGITFYSILKLPILIALLLTFICAFFFGILLERSIISVMIKRKILPIYIVLGTIAISFIIQNGAQATWGSVVLQFPPVFSVSTLKIFGVTAQSEAYASIAVSIALMYALHIFMTKTKFGTSMRSAAVDSLAAESCGINTSLTTGMTWGLASAVAALAGILLGPMFGVYVQLGANIGRKGFAGAVMGGYGNIYGAMVGGMILGLLETFVAGYWIGTYKNLIAYTVLLIFLFIKPTGIFNEKAILDV